MPSPIEKLQKFLSLETERRFDNRAVVGGLEKVQPTWDREAKESGIPISLVQAISDKLIQYPTIDSLIREEVVTEILTLLDKAKQYSSQPTTQIPVPAKPESTIYSTSQPKSNGHDSRPLDRNPQQQKNRPIQSKPIPADLPNGLNAPLTVLKGIGGSGAGQFANMGISSLGDLLYYLPRRYDDYSALKPINRLQYEDELTIIAMVTSSSTRNIHGGKRSITELIVSDGTGYLRLNFFNNPYITNRFVQGSQVVVSGKVEMYLGRLVMNHPTIELLEKEHLNTNRIVPVYPLKAGITQQSLRKNIHQVITYWAGRINDFLPGDIRTSASLIDLQTALRQVHFPDSQEKLKLAKDRLAFDEIFLMQLGVQRQKRAWQAGTARVFNTDQTWLEAFTNKLPYQLTGAQTKTIREISQDLASGKAMNRLIQGDVGSGKTIVAAMGISIVGKHQAQSALLAPTSILADQHYRNLSKALSGSEDSPFNTDEICLLVGDTPEAEKSVIREGLKNGSIKLVIGTHALLEDPVVFSDLQLIVIDEQHRFGVEQRAILRAKGDNPHLLVMTATPIPRSLALTIYGDLDLSVMDEMPAGRQIIDTKILHPLERERAYQLIRSQVALGFQAFIIYPLIENAEDINGDEVSTAAVDEHKRLQNEIFYNQKIGLLHGKMKPDEKEKVMAGFRDKGFDILVSTSVVEVGVDIPNATVMLIEGAEKFGLAQLHQFRGRVGRSDAKSYCLLIPQNDTAIENERLSAMAETNDGFVLAEKDLKQRGPGEFLGTRQSGFAEFQMANLMDVRLIEKARNFAIQVFENDPDLSLEEHKPLFEALQKFWRNGKGDVS